MKIYRIRYYWTVRYEDYLQVPAENAAEAKDKVKQLLSLGQKMTKSAYWKTYCREEEAGIIEDDIECVCEIEEKEEDVMA